MSLCGCEEGLDPVSVAATLKTFFCKAGVTGNLELKRRQLLLSCAKNDGHSETVLVQLRCLVNEGDVC